MRPITLMLAMAAFAATRPVYAQGTASGSVFVTTLGVDTIAVEQYTRLSNRIQGEVAIRNPRVRTIDYAATLDATGAVTRFEMTSRFAGDPPTTPPVIERVSVITDSVVTTEVRRNGVRDTTASGRATLPRRGAVPFVQSGTAFLEQMVYQMIRAGVDSLPIPQFVFGPNHAFPSFVRRLSRDSVEVNLGVPLYARINDDGRLLAVSARATTVRTETARVASGDVKAIVASWVTKERAGERAGAVSPRDTVRAKIGTAEIWVDYGRPSRRGRQVFGALVPFDTVWRTGANAATQIRTSTDIVVGGTKIPAGMYTLWTIPTRTGATLVINTQTGQWGTQYDPTRDVARVPMRVGSAPQPIERLTIDLPTTSSGPALRIAWDNREMIVPVTIQ